ncbi:MAG: isochorismatase family protein [Streptosporangiaceae bacterium]
MRASKESYLARAIDALTSPEERAEMHHEDPSTAIDDAVAPEPDDIVVRKTRVGAMFTTDLDRQLRDRGIDTLVLAGLSTSGVVLSTLKRAEVIDTGTLRALLGP